MRSLWIVAFAILGPALADAGEKVTVCHAPPGNSQSAHTIVVGEAAADAHLGHGDTFGPCASGCEADPSVCDDGDGCTLDTCEADGECAHAAVSCDDLDACTDDGCDGFGGCTHVPAATQPEATEGSCPESGADDCEGSATALCRSQAATCDDGADGDCDGAVDAGDSDCWFCGDGVVQTGVATPGSGCSFDQVRFSEQCDDGNDNPFDGCDHCIIVDITPD